MREHHHPISDFVGLKCDSRNPPYTCHMLVCHLTPRTQYARPAGVVLSQISPQYPVGAYSVDITNRMREPYADIPEIPYSHRAVIVAPRKATHPNRPFRIPCCRLYARSRRWTWDAITKFCGRWPVEVASANVEQAHLFVHVIQLK